MKKEKERSPKMAKSDTPTHKKEQNGLLVSPRTPQQKEKARKVAILNGGKSEALSRISNYYSSDDESDVSSSKSPKETRKSPKKSIDQSEDDLVTLAKKREEDKKQRKRKFQFDGGYWGIGKVRPVSF